MKPTSEERENDLKAQRRIGGNVTRRRVGLGIDRAELARLMECDVAEVAAIEAGRADPTGEILQKAAGALRCGIAVILEGVDWVVPAGPDEEGHLKVEPASATKVDGGEIIAGDGEARRRFCENIVSRREALGMSRADFATDAGLSMDELAEIEAGNLWVDTARLIRIAQVLGFEADDMFAGLHWVLRREGEAEGHWEID